MIALKRYFPVLMLTVFALIGCDNESNQIGATFFSGGSIDYTYLDSATVSLSTVQYEEVATNTNSRLVLGNYTDAALGKVTAAAFLQLNPESRIDLSDEDVIYQYAAVVLKYDSYVYYDSSELSLSAYRVVEDIETDDDGYIYNHSSFAIDDLPLGTLDFRPRPNRDDSVEIVLNDEIGQTLFELAADGSDEMTIATFAKYFQGIALIPDANVSSAMIGVSTTPELRVYYVDRSETPVEETYFSIPATIHSTRLYLDRTGTGITELPQDERLDASLTNDMAFIQSGAGLATRVDFPYIEDLQAYPNLHVTSAVLEISTVRKSITDLTPVPSTLSVNIVGKSNEIIQSYSLSAGLVKDVNTGRDTRYTLDVTSFVKAKLQTSAYKDYGLMLLPTDFNSSIDRVLLANPSYEYKTQLKIYYATITD